MPLLGKDTVILSSMAGTSEGVLLMNVALSQLTVCQTWKHLSGPRREGRMTTRGFFHCLRRGFMNGNDADNGMNVSGTFSHFPLHSQS